MIVLKCNMTMGRSKRKKKTTKTEISVLKSKLHTGCSCGLRIFRVVPILEAVGTLIFWKMFPKKSTRFINRCMNESC